ncbi:MAG: phospholipase D family protein [Gemmatimonadetes bacterium]|nr:phospholipase D family protein [Gemmatimonadota bacterium]
MKLGDEVSSILNGAKYNVLIAAPFIRSEALIRLIDVIPTDIETTVVTRWRPSDLLSGVSDLAVYDLTVSHGIPLFVRQDLHAKYFAVDDECLVGSANVTLTALGWKTPANLELLTTVSRNSDRMKEFESSLMSGAVKVTAAHHARLEHLLKKLKESSVDFTNAQMISALKPLPPNWVPKSRNPEELYSVYCGNLDVIRSALNTMKDELLVIGALPGLDEDGFRAIVAATIAQSPLIDRVIRQIDSEGQVSETELHAILTAVGIEEGKYNPRDVLQVLERWFSYFLSDHYETASDSIKLIKAQKI